MDEHRFSAALRALGAGTTRRRGLASALGVLLAGAGVAGSDARGKGAKHGRDDRREERPETAGPCGDGSRAANICKSDKECCTQLCNTKKGRCRCVKRGEACTSSKNCCNSMKCQGGVCAQPATCPVAACNAQTCPNGCCDGTTCVTATSSQACGTGGAACVTCSSSLAPVCSAGACVSGTWGNQYISTNQPTYSDSDPQDVFVSADELTLWAADAGNSRIAVWTRPSAGSPAWTFNAEFGNSGGNALSSPYGVTASPDSLTVWVADYSGSNVSVWTRPNVTSTSWDFVTSFASNGTDPDQLQNPFGLTVSLDTLTVWIADAGNNRIAVWTRPNATSTAWSYAYQIGTGTSQDNDDSFNYPKGVVVSPDTLTMWVADESNNRISIWTRPDAASTAWSFNAKFGANGSGPGEFQYPSGVFASVDGLTAWVADTGNSRVSIWNRPDSTSTNWTYRAEFGADSLSGPTKLAVSADSLTAWVTNPSYYRIQIWSQF